MFLSHSHRTEVITHQQKITTDSKFILNSYVYIYISTENHVQFCYKLSRGSWLNVSISSFIIFKSIISFHFPSEFDYYNYKHGTWNKSDGVCRKNLLKLTVSQSISLTLMFVYCYYLRRQTTWLHQVHQHMKHALLFNQQIMVTFYLTSLLIVNFQIKQYVEASNMQIFSWVPHKHLPHEVSLRIIFV